MFQKGNKLSQGRPRISLTKPELLMPAIFSKGAINWSNDFLKLYRAMRERANTHSLEPEFYFEGKAFDLLDVVKRRAILMERNRLQEEAKLLRFFETFMPYLCTKVQLKEIMGQASVTTPADSAAQAKQTSRLLQALENENAARPSSQS